MKKLALEALDVESFETAPATRSVRGTVAAHAPTHYLECPHSAGGTCVMTGCQPCYTDPPCG